MLYISFYANWVYLYLLYYYKKFHNFEGDLNILLVKKRGRENFRFTIHSR
jgi:hypothetical protein